MKFVSVFSFLAFSLLASEVSAASLTLSFTDNSGNETGFEVERCQGSGCTGFAQIVALGVNVTNYVDNGLPEGVMFCYRVRAVNAGGSSGYTNTACATTKIAVPAAPSNLQVQ